MFNPFKRPTQEQLRASLLEDHKRQLLRAGLHYEHAKANLAMQQAIVEHLAKRPAVLHSDMCEWTLGLVDGICNCEPVELAK